MQYAFTICSQVACTTLQYFSTLSHKWHDFRKRVTENKTCVLIFSTNLSEFVFHYKKKRARYDHKRNLSSRKIPVIFVLFGRDLNLLDRFSKNIGMSNLMKIRPVRT